MYLARAPRRTARKKGSGYENGQELNVDHEVMSITWYFVYRAISSNLSKSDVKNCREFQV